MTPQERSALIEASCVIVDLLASYDVESAVKLQNDLKGRTLSDGEAVRLATEALRVAGGELIGMTYALRTAVKMGSDYGAAFQAVQADAATHARRARKERQATRAHALRDEGLSVSRIALRMATEDGRQASDRTVEPYPNRTIERWLSSNNPDQTS
ncbi:MAG: hypothetical protein ABJC24_10080 [Chloroflexota bacterium]